MNHHFHFFFLFLLFVKMKQSDDYDFLYLKNKNSSLCDLKITTDNLIIFDKCILSHEWKLSYEKSTSQNSLEVYENKKTTRRLFNIEYVIDNHKSQKDINFKEIIIKAFDNRHVYVNNINISNTFPMTLKKGDNFDVIVEYENYNLTYINLVLSIFMVNNIDSKVYDLNFGYRKIISNDYNNKIDLSYLFLIIFFIIFIFLLRLKFLIEENQFIQVHIDEYMQGKNAETIFVVAGIVLAILLFFMIIKYIYYITFIFSILLAVLSVKSFFKYLFKIIFPTFAKSLDNKFLEIKGSKIEYSNVIYYPMSILVILFWYNVTDDTLYLHTILNNIIFFSIVYFNVKKLNLKNFWIITGLSFSIIFYQLIKIILDENAIQKDTNNVYYITTRFIIDVPIRFILKDFIDSPFEEIYFFSILDIVLIGFVIHYCDNSYILSKIYLKISIYGTFIGLIINIILFYTIKFSPPISTIPLFISIVSLIIYSIYQKQFLDFMDLEKNEKQVFKDMVEIQEIHDNQIELFRNSGNFNISFNDKKMFEEEKEILKNDTENNEKEDISDDELKKKHENMINMLGNRMNLNNDNNLNINKINSISIQQEDSDIEGMEKFIDLVRGISEKQIKSPSFSPDKNRRRSEKKEKPHSSTNINKDELKMVEMKFFEEEKKKDL